MRKCYLVFDQDKHGNDFPLKVFLTKSVAEKFAANRLYGQVSLLVVELECSDDYPEGWAK